MQNKEQWEEEFDKHIGDIRAFKNPYDDGSYDRAEYEFRNFIKQNFIPKKEITRLLKESLERPCLKGSIENLIKKYE